jgi:hypothetical protein
MIRQHDRSCGLRLVLSPHGADGWLTGALVELKFGLGLFLV